MKIKYFIAASLLAVVGFFGLTSVAHAEWSQNAATGDTVTLAKDKTHKGAFYAAGSTVKIEGTVDGDVYCAGETIEITGSVSGSVLCAGKSVHVAGTVGRDIRVAGQNVTIDSKTEGAVSMFAQTATISQTATVAGEGKGGAQKIRIEGTGGEKVRVGGEEGGSGAVVGGNADIGAGHIIINDKGKVTGNLNYQADKELQLPQDKVGGKISYNPVPESEGKTEAAGAAMGFVMMAVMLLGSALLIAAIMPRFLQRSVEITQKGFGFVLVAGLITLFSIPFFIFFLAISIVGIPVAIILLLAWCVVMLLSGAFFAYWVGSLLLKKSNNILVRMGVGALVTLVLCLIPFVGVLVVLAALIIGSGMITRTLTYGYRAPNYRVTLAQPPKQRPGRKTTTKK